MENATHDLAGADLDGLRIIEKLGSGGMGDVWKGHDEDLDIPVAIKVLKPEFAADQNFLVRFLREARACAKMEHPNIVGVKQAGRRSWHGGNLRIMVMEFVDGQNSHELLKAQRKGKLKPERAAEIVLAAAKALKYAHSKGVIHRDIKPANILVGKDGVIKVLDFGLAKLTGAPFSRSASSSSDREKADLEIGAPSSTNAILGTPHYMPPEQAQGRPADGRADIYSLGITLYQLLTGALPFEGDNTFSIIAGHVRDELPLTEERFGDLPPVFAELISGMCEKKPDDRLALKLIIDRLEEFLGGSAPSPSSSKHESIAVGSRTNLLKRETSFVGRSAEIAAIGELLESARLVTVVGPGGVGKTRITQEFGLSVADQYEGGVWFCDLTEARSLDGICLAVSQGLNVPLTQADSLAQVEAILFMRKPLLLIMDNFEQVVEYAAETLGRWMAKAPKVKFLTSSREPLHLEGEMNFPLSPLVGEEARDGLQLFVDRAVAAKRGFVLDESNREAVAEIVDQLDGIPLAIELAASRCSALSPQKLLERLPQRFDLLKGRRQDASARQATLRGAIDWSWDLLKDYEQSALAQCSVFQGGFFLEAGEAVIDLSDFPDAPFEMDVIESLVEKSLLVSLELASLPGEVRYRMLESIRQYAAEKVMEIGAPSGNADALLLRHAEHYLEYAEHWDEATNGQNVFEALNRVEAEYENLFGIQEVFEKSRPELAARAILYAANTLKIRGPWKERIPRIERALNTLVAVDDLALRIRLGCALTLANYDCGSKQSLERAAQRTCELAAKLAGDDPETQALRLGSAQAQLLACARTGNLEEAGNAIDQAFQALGYQTEGVALASRHFDVTLRRAIATCVGNRGLSHEGRGDYDLALACFAEAEAIARELGNQFLVAVNVASRGIVHKKRGEHDQALACYAEAEAIARELGDQKTVIINVGNLGNVHMTRGEHEEALACFAEAESIARELGNQYAVAINVGNRGNSLRELGRPVEASKAFEEAEAVCRAIAAHYPLAYWTLGKASVLLDRGVDLEQALAFAQETLGLRTTMGMQKTGEYFETVATLAVIEKRLGKLGEAYQHALQAKALGEELEISRIVEHGPKAGEVTELWRWVEEALAAE